MILNVKYERYEFADVMKGTAFSFVVMVFVISLSMHNSHVILTNVDHIVYIPLSMFTDLSDENYAEALIKENLLDTKLDFYSEVGHQLNIAEFNGKTIVATDAKEYHSFFLNRVNW